MSVCSADATAADGDKNAARVWAGFTDLKSLWRKARSSRKTAKNTLSGLEGLGVHRRVQRHGKTFLRLAVVGAQHHSNM